MHFSSWEGREPQINCKQHQILETVLPVQATLVSEESVASPLSWCSLPDMFLTLLSVASPLRCWCLASARTAVRLLCVLCAMRCYRELTQMPSLEVLAAVGRRCGVAQGLFTASSERLCFLCSAILPLVQTHLSKPSLKYLNFMHL